MQVLVAANRMKHPLDARTLARLARCGTRTRGIVGFGPRSDERRGMARDFDRAFHIAREGGLLSAPHGGELTGPASVGDCLDDLDATRIGHGVRAAEDPRLLKALADRGVTASVPGVERRARCLRSPRTCRCALFEAGVPMALGADDPLLFGSRLAAQYEIARRHRLLRRPNWPSWHGSRCALRGARGTSRPSSSAAWTRGWSADRLIGRLGAGRAYAMPVSSVGGVCRANSSTGCGGLRSGHLVGEGALGARAQEGEAARVRVSSGADAARLLFGPQIGVEALDRLVRAGAQLAHHLFVAALELGAPRAGCGHRERLLVEERRFVRDVGEVLLDRAVGVSRALREEGGPGGSPASVGAR